MVDIPQSPSRAIIAGGRNYQLGESEFRWLDSIHAKTPIIEVISGGAPGADLGGELWAKTNGIPIKRFPAEWKQFGHSAGPRRNQSMANYLSQNKGAALVILFPGGRGTDSMRRIALRECLPVVHFK